MKKHFYDCPSVETFLVFKNDFNSRRCLLQRQLEFKKEQSFREQRLLQ